MVLYSSFGTMGLAKIAERQKEKAERVPSHALKEEEWKAEYCSFFLAPYRARCILTLDTGMHSGGLFGNPDCEACWHLRLSFIDLETGEEAPYDHGKAAEIVSGLFESTKRLVWVEPPNAEGGKGSGVWHYRVFVDVATLTPILPRPGVHQGEFSGKGWTLFAHIQDME